MWMLQLGGGWDSNLDLLGMRPQMKAGDKLERKKKITNVID